MPLERLLASVRNAFTLSWTVLQTYYIHLSWVFVLGQYFFNHVSRDLVYTNSTESRPEANRNSTKSPPEVEQI